jgi:CRISPR system Cascade subunit CasD
MVTGLCANALGYDSRALDELARLQERMRVGARRDREGERFVDFQTVDLGQPHLSEGWTTDGRTEGREGGVASTGTHIRLRHYIADAAYAVGITLNPEGERPTLDDLARALDAPSRPLFIGRKCCLPSERLCVGIVEADSILDALIKAPLARRAKPGRKLLRVPRGTPPHAGFAASERAITEERDWANQIHVGRQRVLEGFVESGHTETSA